MALERELAHFEKELPRLLAEGHQGKHVLIGDDRVVGIWPTLEEALQAGYDTFGVKLFLVKEITAHPEPLYFSRNVKPCP